MRASVADELPPTRVYTDCGGETFELTVIVSRVIPFETDWSQVVGRTRFDGFFLLPVQHVSRPECKLMMDWAINRSDHVISEFETGVPLDVPVREFETYTELARELELCYANISMVTDHDVGVEGQEPVDAGTVVRVFTENNERLRELLFAAIPRIGPQPQDVCATALEGARV